MIDRERILITGAEGRIGRAFPVGIRASRRLLDVESPGSFEDFVRERKPSAILHLAGMPLAECQTNPERAAAVNVLGTQRLAKIARALDVPFVFLSSGNVFNGSGRAVHDERALPRPRTVYAWTKIAAESWAREIYPRTLIVRTGWVFGARRPGYAEKFIERAVAAITLGQRLATDDALVGSPVYVHDLIAEIWRLLDVGASGLRHVSNDGEATGTELAAEIARILGKPLFRTMGAVGRGGSEALSTQHHRLRPWPQALRDYLLKDLGA